jgi:two-component system, OmpR family, sensor kinase
VARHFLGLYALIVLTLATVSWAEDKLLQMYSGQGSAADRSQAVALSALADRFERTAGDDRRPLLAEIAAGTGASLELFAREDIAGARTLGELDHGKIAYMQASAGRIWALKELGDGSVLAYEYDDADAASEGKRRPIEWALTFVFYGAIALVIMLWIWPLRRDLSALERAAAGYGNRNWTFDADITPRSQIYRLAETFRKMAARIDGLIASHKDMSNAVSHEIKTPLARMQFEIELAAQRTDDGAALKASLGNLKTDVAAINDLVTATLGYAILERADVALNLGTHDFSALVPALAEHVVRETRPEILVRTELHGDAGRVVCDLHLIESVFKNLLYNAARYARREIRVAFNVHDAENELIVDDDGPGIPAADRRRVFESFVQLDANRGKKTGFGLGLAIVKRALEWHGGEVTASESPLGGARFRAVWPRSAAG